MQLITQFRKLIQLTALAETLEQYRMFPEMVKVIIGAGCLYDGNCMMIEDRPTGIPRWKSKFACMLISAPRMLNICSVSLSVT